MIRLIVFDFDGVIITGSNEGYFRCYHKALEDVGVKLDPREEKKRILEWWGKGHKKQLEFLLKEHKGLLTKSIKAYEKYYYSPVFFGKIKLVKGAGISLKKLSQKYTLAIASGMMRKTMDHLIKKFNISYFRKIITNEDVKKDTDKKPAPFMIDKILTDLSISPEETIYVGDAKNDVIMAKNAKVISTVPLLSESTFRFDRVFMSLETVIPTFVVVAVGIS